MTSCFQHNLNSGNQMWWTGTEQRFKLCFQAGMKFSFKIHKCRPFYMKFYKKLCFIFRHPATSSFPFLFLSLDAFEKIILLFFEVLAVRRDWMVSLCEYWEPEKKIWLNINVAANGYVYYVVLVYPAWPYFELPGFLLQQFLRGKTLKVN